VPAEPVVVFAGRHIPEKRVPALVPALALARERLPGLRGEIYGDGPERGEVLRLRSALGLDGALDVPGFVSAERVELALARALCMVLPSRREGYGMVVVEAASVGTPSVVVADPDNAATDLVSDGENGYVAPSASPGDLADAIERVHAEGNALRERTAAWFRANGVRLSLESSLKHVLESYDAARAFR
jgi:glycosyltransferase involved in cell wall biosynthesis